MKRLYFIPFFLILLWSLSDTHVNAKKENSKVLPIPPSIAADSAIIMDAKSGSILYEKNKDKKNYPASTTKLLTTLLALENSSLQDTVSFSKEAVFGIERGSSHIGINVGEQLTMEQCLYGILLASANEVSNAVAEHISGDIPSFVQKMNARAKSLGCKNTNFVNANGLFDQNHYTTAYDLALISKELLKYPVFRQISSTKNYTIPATNLQPEARYLHNHHKMLTSLTYQYPGFIGGKTGFTVKSRYNLATFAHKNDLDLICIVMKEDLQKQQYIDTKALLDFGFENFKSFYLQNAFFHSPFFTTDSARQPLFYQDSPSAFLIPTHATPIFFPTKLSIQKPYSFSPGQNHIGTIIYYYQNQPIASFPIFYTHKVTASKKYNFALFLFLFLWFACLLIILFLFYQYNNRKRNLF